MVGRGPGNPKALEFASESLRDAIFALGREIRYVAFASGQEVDCEQRQEPADASSADSDFYEELFVNPALLTLARQRGELDCGGLRYLIVAYGSFNQVVLPTEDGHVSVCVAPDADPVGAAARIAELLLTRHSRERAPTTPL
jgi:hypothetical protein